MKLTFTRSAVFSLALALVTPSGAHPQGSERREPAEQDATRLILEGVIISTNPASSVALVRRRGARRARSVRVGETVYGLTLVEVSEEAAVFEREGQRELVYLDEGKVAARPEVAGTVDAEPLPTGEKEELLPRDEEDGTGEDWLSREIDRSTTEQRLEKEMPVILAETGISPRSPEEGPEGLQITHLPDGTVLSEVGLLPGDVIISLNEVPLSSVSALTGLLPQIRSESEIRLVVDRQGEILKLAYHIR